MRHVLSLLSLSLLVSLLWLPVQAQPVPRLVSYQGVLFSGGSPVTSATNVDFAFFSDVGCTTAFPASGAWTQTLSVAPDAAGVFSVLLGSTTPTDPAFFDFAFDRLLYLKTSVGGTQVACQALAAVPYALGLYGLRVEPETATDGPNVIGGWSGNSVGAGVVGATISGGGDPELFGTPRPNEVTGDYGAVGGGLGNTASAYATVGGGGSNEASTNAATVGGGSINTAGAAYATVGGGSINTAGATNATVGGGQSNTASDQYATVGGGSGNTASATWATVPGGQLNQAGGSYSFAAGRRAKVRDATATGDSNGDEGTFVWADATNADFTSTGPNQFLIRAGGGVGIGTNSPSSPLTVAGLVESTTGGFKFPDGSTQTTAAAGVLNVWQLGGNAGTTAGTDFLGTTDNVALEVQVNGARVMRYEPETATEGPNVIGGASINTVAPGVEGATIAGGGDPDFGGPSPNEVTADYGTVSGGRGNTASGVEATVAGGELNTASGALAAVGGGTSNTASGSRAMVPGGVLNQAGGSYSLAAGRRAKVRDAATVGGGDTDGDEGTFLWADATNADFTSTGPNQFFVRASGGTAFFSNTAATVGVSLAAGGNTWASVSDSTRKERFLPADGERALREIGAMRLGSWNYRGQDAARFRHYGPMAQDFHAAFGHDGVGVIGTDTTLATGDVDGVLFIAVQALAARTAALQEAQVRIERLETEIDGLRAQVAAVDQVQAEVAALRALVEAAVGAEGRAEGRTTVPRE